MQLSQRLAHLRPSPTIALNAKAKSMEAQGINVCNLAVGEPDFSTPAPIIEKAIASLRAGRTKYGAAGGGLPLRQAICQKLQRDNQLSYRPEQIVVGTGAKEILFHTFLSILNDDDEVLLPAPYWVSYTSHVEIAGGKPITVPMQEDAKGMRLDLNVLERLAPPRTRAIVLNSPNNPGGYVFDAGFLRELTAYLKSKSWWVISDEIYEYLAFDQPHISPLNVCPELADQLILVNGLSKGFAMTGWRVGYAAGPESVIKLIRNLQSQSSTCLPGFIEDAATFALEQGLELMRPAIASLRHRRDLAVQGLSAIPKLRFLVPQGAFYVFLDVREILASATQLKDKSSLALSQRLLEEYQVAMIPGEDFGTPGFLRMSYATSEQTLQDGIERLQQAFTKL